MRLMLLVFLLLPGLAMAQAPTLTAVEPSASNNTHGDVALTVTGTNLGTANAAQFTGPATVNVTGSNVVPVDANSTVLVAPLGSMPVGTYQLRVTAAGGPSTNTLAFRVTSAAPQVNTVAPVAGGNNAAVRVTLSGSGFTNATQLTLSGPVSRTVGVAVASDTSLTATVPAGLTGGQYRLQVTGPGGPSNDDVEFRVDDTRTTGTAQITDQFGNPKTTVNLASDRLFVTVTDRDRDTDANSQQSVTVTVTDSATGDRETLTLVETGNSTGVFRNVTGLTTARAAATQNDGTFQSQPGATITASYADPLFGDTAVATAVAANAPTASATQFTNASGNAQFTYVIGTDRIFIQVTDADRNTNSNLAETVSVTLTDANTGDRESVTLTETGLATGVFRNTVGIASTRTFTGTPGNGTLETVDGSSIRADYSDPNEPGDATFGVATMRDLRASVTNFTDSLGNVKASYVIGSDLVFVTVTDPNVNADPNLAERVNATITVATTGDSETIQLVETGTNTGIFRNTTGVPSRVGQVVANGILDATNNAGITVRYQDPRDPTDVTQANATLRATPTGSTTTFTDANGTAKTEYRIGADGIFVTVTDADQNLNPNAADQITVTLADNRTGDTETVTLVETGNNTGVFRNTQGLTSVVGTAVNNDGTVETANLATLSANYRDPDDATDQSSGFVTMKLAPTSSATFFTDVNGTTKTQFAIGGGDIFLTVQDPDRNTDTATRQAVVATLRDTATGDTESITLLETGANTGIFRNTVGFASTLNTTRTAVPNNATLEVGNGDTITASYVDPVNPPDTSAAAAVVQFITASTTFFSDTVGLRRDAFVIGRDNLFVTVIDRDEGSFTSPPPTVRTVRVSVSDPVTLDVKTLTLTEDPSVLGTFRNTTGLPMVKDAANPGDTNRLHVAAESRLTASYADPNDNSDTSTGNATAKSPATTAAVFFSDINGNPVSTFDIATGLFVTVQDEDRNLNIATTDTVTVTLIDGATGDVETLLVRETGPNTGIFRNTSPFPSKIAVPIQDGILETGDGSTVTANYSDPTDGEFQAAFATAKKNPDPNNPRTAQFTDQTGQTVTRYQIGDPSGLVFVTVNEPDANLNAAVVDQVTVTVQDTNPNQNDTVTVVLTEVDSQGRPATNTGIFRNQTGIASRLASPPLLNNTLEVLANDFIKINYTPRGGLPPSVAPQNAQMVIKPGNSSMQFTDASGGAKSVYTIGAEGIFITLTDSNQNKNPLQVEQVTVSLVSTITGDVEATVRLMETGPSTGVFRNTVGVPSRLAVAVNNDGTVQTGGGAILTANYTDPDDPTDRSIATVTMAVDEQPATRIAFRTGVGVGAQDTTTYEAFTTGKNQVFVQLADADKNTDPTTLQSVTVSIVSSGVPLDDTQTITLTETGVSTGIFESAAPLPITVAPVVRQNGTLEVFDGGGIFAKYVDPLNPGDTLTAIARASVGKQAITTVFFSDSAGTAKATYEAGTDLMFLNIVDPAANRNAGVVETVNATFTSPATGDTLSVLLTETTTSSGIFRNVNGIRTAVAPAAADGVLQVATETDALGVYTNAKDPTSTATARVRMKAKASGSTTRLTDAVGSTKSRFIIGIDPIFVEVNDPDQNRNPTVLDTVKVTLTSTITGDVVVVALTETAVASGVFRNTAGVPSATLTVNTSNSQLETADGATVRATYQDPVTIGDSSFAQAIMALPGTPSQAFFIKSTGSGTVTTAAYAIASDLIRLRVVDPDKLKDPTVVETVRVTVKNDATGDLETITLSEVGPDGRASAAGLRFENLTGLPSAVNLATAGNGTLEVSANTTITLTYVDPNDSTDRSTAVATMVPQNVKPTIQFTDRAGTKVTSYDIGNPNGVFVTVIDPGANKSASTSVRDTLVTSIFDTTTGDVATLTLFEQPDANGLFNSGVFRNLINLPSVIGQPPSDITTILFTANNSTVIASYLRDGSVPGAVMTTVPFDPVISKILTTKSGPNGQSCFTCHSDDNSQGGLNLTGFRDATRGGTRGNPIVPGNSSASLLIRKLETTATNPQALPHPEPGAGDPALKVGGVISAADLAVLKAWIDQGAVAPTLPTSTTYDRVQAQVFTPSCVNRASPNLPACHDPVNQAGGIRLNDISGFLESIRFRQAALLGNGPGSRMVQVLTDPALNHSGVRIDRPVGDPQNISLAAAQLLSTYLSQQYRGAPNPPLREYNGDVQPYFDRNCSTSGCHNGQSRAGGLSLTSFAALNAGGVSGMETNPGDVPRSRLTSKIDRIADPAHTALIPASFFASQGPAAITSWVNQGAFPGAGGVLTMPPTGAVTDTAVMKIGPTTATISFTDGNGVPVQFYKIGDEGVFVTVTDIDRNTSPTTREEIQVTISDARTGDQETVTLTETTPGSAVFRNQSAVPSIVGGKTNGNGRIETVNNSTITATYVDPVFPETVTTTATMTSTSRSITRFVDAGGLPVGRYFIGTDRVVVEVEDADESGRGRLDAGTVTLNVSPTSDQEKLSLVMMEVTTRPGVFHSQALPLTNTVTATRENGQVESIFGGLLSATYVDVAFPTDTSTATAITQVASVNSQMSFTDQFGTTRTQFQIRTEGLFVTLRDANRNISPTTTDTVVITLVNDQNGDSETVTLFEVGKNSGIFRNKTGVSTALVTGPSVGNGVVELTSNGAPSGVIRAHYEDTVAPPDIRDAFCTVVIDSGSTTQFTDTLGNPVIRYVRGRDLIFVTVTDQNQNKDTTKVDTIRVTVTDTSIVPGDEEVLILSETGANTGVFRNKTGLKSVFGFPVAIPENGILETRVNSAVNAGQVIEATYQDPDHLTDISTARAEMVPKNINDSDDDGMPDDFEIRFGLNPFDPSDAGLDFDGDGFTNLEEFQNGTDPTNPFDNKPVADAGQSRRVDPGVVQLDGSASRDPRARALTYRWTQALAGQPGHGPAVTLSDAKAVKPTFVGFGGRTRAGADLSLFDFDLVVSNFRVSSNPSRVEITVNDVPPSPFAGIDQALTLGESIALNGKETRDANDPETPELAYAWSRPIGSGGFNTGIAAPLVLPNLVGTMDFALTVSDAANNAAVDHVFVVVHQGTNHVPLASLPARLSAVVGRTLAIDGSASADADVGDQLTYHWRVTRVPDGAGLVTPLPADGQISKTNVVFPRAGYYEVTLTVTDQRGNTSPPAVVGIVADFLGSGSTPPDRVPVAATGANLTGQVNGTVTLDGRGSKDPDGNTLTFNWTQTRGVHVALNNATGATPSFVPLFPGVYGFELRVSDGVTESAPAPVFVTVSSLTQHVPVASAGPDQVVQLADGGSTITLNGAGSADADGDRLIYYWHQVAGPGIALANRETPRPTFFTRQFGTYVFELTVYDGKNFSLPGRVTVQVNPFGVNVPVADAGPNQTAFFAGDPVQVQLDGSRSNDPGGSPLTYSWSQVDGPSVTLDPGPDVASPTFSAPAIGKYRFQLVVRNAKNVPSVPAFTLVTVVDGTIEPPQIVVNGAGGSSATVTSQGGVPITLDASASRPRTGGQLSYVWSQVSGPAVLIENASSAKASVVPAAAGTYVFSVAVLDARGNQGTGTVTVLVGSDAPPGTTGVSGDPGVIVETGGSSGGGGGGCEARHRGASADVNGLSMLWIALFWLALVAVRARRPKSS